MTDEAIVEWDIKREEWAVTNSLLSWDPKRKASDKKIKFTLYKYHGIPRNSKWFIGIPMGFSNTSRAPLHWFPILSSYLNVKYGHIVHGRLDLDMLQDRQFWNRMGNSRGLNKLLQFQQPVDNSMRRKMELSLDQFIKNSLKKINKKVSIKKYYNMNYLQTEQMKKKR